MFLEEFAIAAEENIYSCELSNIQNEDPSLSDNHSLSETDSVVSHEDSITQSQNSLSSCGEIMDFPPVSSCSHTSDVDDNENRINLPDKIVSILLSLLMIISIKGS